MVNDARPTSDDILHGRERAGRRLRAGVRTLHGVEEKKVGAILRDRSDDKVGAALEQRTRAVGAHGAPDRRNRGFERGAPCAATSLRSCIRVLANSNEYVHAASTAPAKLPAMSAIDGETKSGEGDIWEEEAAHDVMQ
jgi:hypothetical protein